ncbi:hypothetical protein AVEN_170390-1 [Araneus ventricosus]|uniref:Uncharacterized protein n=1 Tax=Araneus ventricosus TaxID=182803 RepID=A0A4Y2GH93_ARAVE|nr:hypothetical protein AVEN_170390-1 [Araneus ventricosus]
MTAEETEELSSDDQLREIARRNNESFEVRNQHQASYRLRTLNLRATEKLRQLPEPLKSLMEGNHPKSKEILSIIREYNSSFQMTSFGTSLCMLDSTVFMPTFRIRGQVYHKPESLMSFPNEEAQFLQKYFLGN